MHYFKDFIYLFIYLLTVPAQAGGGAEEGRGRDSQAGTTFSMNPAAGLDLRTRSPSPERKPRVGHLPD